MGKRDHYFQKIVEYKERVRSLSTEAIRRRLSNAGDVLYPEARIALRQLLKEREGGDDTARDNNGSDS